MRGAPVGRLALPRARLRAAALALAVLGAELVVAGAVVEPRFTKLLAPVVAVAALALVFALPFAATCLFMALSASVLYDTFFTVNAAGRPVSAPELLLGALLIVAVLRPRRVTWGGTAGGALLAFLAVVMVATLVAVSAGRVDLNTGINYARPFFVLTFFWVVVRLFGEPGQVRMLLVVAVALAALTGVVALVVSLGGSVSSPLQGPGNQTITADQGLGSLLRVRLPGVALAYGLFWFVAGEALGARGRRALWTAALAAAVACIVVSSNRNMWLGLVLGLAVVLVAGGSATRQRLTAAVAVGVVGIVLLVIAGPEVVGPTSALSPLVERGQTLLTPGRELQDQSLKDRGKETTQAWQTVRHHLLLGLGPGAPFGVFFKENLGGGRLKRVPQRFIHNQYLYLVVVGGAGAVLAFLAYLGITLRAAWRGRHRDAALGTLFTGLVMVMLSSTVMLSFSDSSFLVLLALVGGAVYALTQESEPLADAM